MDVFLADRKLNISPAYLRPGFAFGGSCLPKDLRGLVHAARQADVVGALLVARAAVQRGRICSGGGAGRSRTAGAGSGLFGLSFKPGTDDLRESPLVELAERLIGKGYDLRIYDANVSLSRLIGANREYIETRLPHLAHLLADSVDEVLDARRGVHRRDARTRPCWRRCPTAPRPVIIDLVRLPDADARRTDQGYVGLAW